MSKLINTTTWKEFTISDIFTIKRGKRHKKEDHIDGEYYYISSKENDNGIDGKISYIPGCVKEKNVLGINNSGSVTKVFYHPYEAIFSDHVTILKLKNKEFNRNLALFIIPVLEKLKPKYLFGRELNNQRLSKEKIKLPADSKGNPDWEWMENYIKELWETKIPNLEEFRKPKNEVKVGLKPILEWGEFKISTLFKIINGIKYPSDIRIKGKIPLVSTSGVNNGITDYIEERTGMYKQIITVAYSGTVGATFYHENPIFVGETVFALVPKFKISKYIGNFLIVVLRKNNLRYSYGRKIKGSKYGNDIIKLPMDSNGNPDWEYMEAYIKSLPYSNKI